MHPMLLPVRLRSGIGNRKGTTMKPAHFLFAAFLAGALIAGPAFAQKDGLARQGSGPGMMMGQGGMMGGMMGSGMGSGMMGSGMMGGGCGMMMGGPAADGELDTHVDGRVAFLEAELAITPDQQGVWNGYADALRSNAGVMVSMHRKMRDAMGQQDGAPTARLDLHIDMMKSRLAALEALKPATEALYVALTPEQKQKANRLLPVMGCM
ncbi:MAG: hypothetical protein CVT83_08145 [Alphaproteobacteria bacterium HGW-Alphaproteobacteria-5]|nr:MAG: hypothetical protein CVT83_08145 [Alphaproteobacteria bacterium HGW-Alphaproteobacteria-5]